MSLCVRLCATVAVIGSLRAAMPPRLNTVGAAQIVAGNLQLTPPETHKVGAAWLLDKRHVIDGFDASFQFRITDPGGLGGGADGFAFVLQSAGPNAMAGRGASGGFALGDGYKEYGKPGIPNSIAVFFDTFRNNDAGDPSNNYIAVCANGPVGKMNWPPSRLGLARKLKVKLKDGAPHTVRIQFRPPVFTVSLDDEESLLRVPLDIRTVVDNGGNSYLGFTASTGSGYARHQILDFSLTPLVESTISEVESNIIYFPTTCLEGRNLCTPAEATVEPGPQPDSYHVIVPAHLTRAASISNPENRAVVVTNVHGGVCWQPDNAAGCSGPEGLAGQTNTSDFLAPDRNPGALIHTTENGRTWFYVNGRRGAQAKLNEGFFEFDVVLK